MADIHLIMAEFSDRDGVVEESYPVEAFYNLQGALDYLAELAKEFRTNLDEEGLSVYLPGDSTGRTATYYTESVGIS